MKSPLNFLAVITLSLCTPLTHAAGADQPVRLAQAKPSSPAAKKTTRTLSETATAGCAKDSAMALDKETWCRRGTLFQCNARTGNWIGTGKRCP